LEDRDERQEAYTIDAGTEGTDLKDLEAFQFGPGDASDPDAVAGETEPEGEAPAVPERRSSQLRAHIEGVEAGVAAGLVAPAPAEETGPDDEDAELGPSFEPQAEAAPLPDWRDPPTRELPRVLLEHGMADRSPTIPGPVWREVESDWDHDDLTFADLVNEGTSVAEHTLSPDEPDPFGFDFVVDPVGRSTAAADPHSTAPVGDLDADSLDTGEPTQIWSGSPYEEDDPWASEPEVTSATHDEQATFVAEPADPADATVRDRGKPAHRARVTLAGRKRRAPALKGAGSVEELLSTGTRAVDPVTARPPSSGTKRDPVIATLTGLGVGIVALLCFHAGPPLTLALVTLVLVVSIAECYQALRRAHYRPAVLLGLLGVPALTVSVYLKGPDAFPIVGAAFVMATMGWYLLGLTRKDRIANLSATVMSFAWVGMLGSFAALLLDPAVFGHRHGVAYLLGAIEATVAYDVGGYAFGSWIGKRKLAPSISPNKTWGGLVGGCFAAIAVAVGVTSHMAPWTLTHAAELGVVVAVFAPIGDLAESMIKRELRVKDMGSVLPAHGGVLDRIDALLFVLPATYCLVRIFHG